MREIILKKNNCDDIALNFIIGYYYPEMAPVGLSGNVKNISPRVSQANMPTHYVYRKECC